MEKYTAIKNRSKKYLEILDLAKSYRKEWKEKTRNFLQDQLALILTESGIDAEIKLEDKLTGMEVVTLRLGIANSGIYQELGNGEQKRFLKDFGTLIYSQIYNGKVQAWMTYPVVEGLTEPKPPKFLEIDTPFELTEDVLLRHFDNFIKFMCEWEDFDDDSQQTAPIGFGFVGQQTDRGKINKM